MNQSNTLESTSPVETASIPLLALIPDTTSLEHIVVALAACGWETSLTVDHVSQERGVSGIGLGLHSAHAVLNPFLFGGITQQSWVSLDSGTGYAVEAARRLLLEKARKIAVTDTLHTMGQGPWRLPDNVPVPQGGIAGLNTSDAVLGWLSALDSATPEGNGAVFEMIEAIKGLPPLLGAFENKIRVWSLASYGRGQNGSGNPCGWEMTIFGNVRSAKTAPANADKFRRDDDATYFKLLVQHARASAPFREFKALDRVTLIETIPMAGTPHHGGSGLLRCRDAIFSPRRPGTPSAILDLIGLASQSHDRGGLPPIQEIASTGLALCIPALAAIRKSMDDEDTAPITLLRQTPALCALSKTLSLRLPQVDGRRASPSCLQELTAEITRLSEIVSPRLKRGEAAPAPSQEEQDSACLLIDDLLWRTKNAAGECRRTAIEAMSAMSLAQLRALICGGASLDLPDPGPATQKLIFASDHAQTLDADMTASASAMVLLASPRWHLTRVFSPYGTTLGHDWTKDALLSSLDRLWYAFFALDVSAARASDEDAAPGLALLRFHLGTLIRDLDAGVDTPETCISRGRNTPALADYFLTPGECEVMTFILGVL